MFKLYYWLYLKIFRIPCRDQVAESVIEKNSLPNAIVIVCIDYAMGLSLEYTAARNNITRERARQYLFKAVRQ